MTAIHDYPGELAIVAHRDGWQLLIHGPYLTGEVVSPHREKLDRLAEAYGQLRRTLDPPGGLEGLFRQPGGQVPQ